MKRLDEYERRLVQEQIAKLIGERRRKMRDIDREYQREITRLRDMIDFGVPQRMVP